MKGDSFRFRQKHITSTNLSLSCQVCQRDVFVQFNGCGQVTVRSWEVNGFQRFGRVLKETFLAFNRFYLIPRAMSAAKCACCGSSISLLLDLIKFFRSPLAINSETSMLQGVLYCFVPLDKSLDILKKYFRDQDLCPSFTPSVLRRFCYSVFS